MSIHDFAGKIKSQAGESRSVLIFLGILVLASGISFYLGYTARAESHVESPVVINCPVGAYMDPVSLESTSQTAVKSAKTGDMSVPASSSGAYVASRNGTKYYPVACSGAKRIKDENKVYFNSVTEAVSAGYSLASGCSS